MDDATGMKRLEQEQDAREEKRRKEISVDYAAIVTMTGACASLVESIRALFASKDPSSRISAERFSKAVAAHLESLVDNHNNPASENK